MKLQEMVQLFLDSRKRGITGARKKASPRTVSVYDYNLRILSNFLATETGEGGVVDYVDIKRLHIVQFIDWVDKKIDKKEWSLATRLQVLRSVKTFFRWVEIDEDCREAGLKAFDKYLPVIAKCPRRIDIPQIKDLRTFKNTFNTKNRWGFRDYVAMSLMLDNGIRIGEVCNLKLDMLMIESRLMIVSGKTGPRPLPITEEMATLFKGWLKRRASCPTAKDSPYVFVSKYEPQMSPNGFGQRFRKHRKKFGLPRITPHTCRHSFSTNFLIKGGDLEKLRLMTGHTSYEMLKDYLHLSKVAGTQMKDQLEKVSLLRDL